MIEADGLRRSFRGVRAVEDVSFRVRPGEVVGFLGPNGAGKSTTLRMLAGLLRAEAGHARIAGHDPAVRPAAARAALGYMPEAAAGFGDLTVAEFLAFCAEGRGYRGAERDRMIRRAAERTALAPALGEVMRRLSKGWRQRAWFAQAVMHGPPAVILDEPTDGLDPGQKTQIRALIRELSADTAVLLTTHLLEEAEAVCDRAVVIARGRIVADRPLPELLDGRGRLGPAFAALTAEPLAAGA